MALRKQCSGCENVFTMEYLNVEKVNGVEILNSI